MATFPKLPGVDVSVVRGQSFATTVLRMWNGREVRIGRQTSPIVSIKMVVNFARDNVNCTASGWTSYSELAALKKIHADCFGSLSTLEIPDPDGGATLTVRFAEDQLVLTQVVPHVWAGEIGLVQAL